MLRKYRFGGKKLGVLFGVKICMNIYCIVMFEFNYSVRDIKNSDLGGVAGRENSLLAGGKLG